MLCKTCNITHDGLFGSGKFCSRKCANSRVRTDEIKQKTSETLKEGHRAGRIATGHTKGMTLPPRTEDHCRQISGNMKQYWDIRGRKTEAQRKAGVAAGVYAYRARKKNAIPLDADLALIKLIYESTPDGYQVDHIVALANGGLHHQDNLQYLPFRENARKGKRSVYNESLVVRWQDIL
jgi:5-methylcytosine-specific restriction endonuclease McrA